MPITNEFKNYPSWKHRIKRLPSWVMGGFGGALLFILISLPIAIAFWVTDERLLIIPLFGLFFLGIPPLLFVIIGALLASRMKNIIKIPLLLILFTLLSGTCIYGAVLGMYGISG